MIREIRLFQSMRCIAYMRDSILESGIKSDWNTQWESNYFPFFCEFISMKKFQIFNLMQILPLIPRMYLSFFPPHREKCNQSPTTTNYTVKFCGNCRGCVYQSVMEISSCCGVKITFIIPVSPCQVSIWFIY